MPKSTILFLLTSIFALVSCGSNPMHGLTPTAVTNPVYRAVYFADPKADYVYRTNISVYGNEMGGIFVAKRISETAHRVVFTTEFGNKLFDFEISETDFKVNSIVDELDRAMLIDTLVKDFRLLLRENYAVAQQFDDGDFKILKTEDGKHFNYLIVSKADGKLTQIKHATKRKEKITLTFISENNIFAQSFTIQHHDIKLKIEFNQFKNQ